MPETHARRRANLLSALDEHEVDAALITRLVNVRYLTGFTGSNGALLLRRDGQVLLATDGRYTTQVGAQAPDVDLLTERVVAPALAKKASDFGVRRLGFEAHEVTVEQHGVLTEHVPELASLKRAVEQLRAIKDDDEIALLREACAIADRALADLLAHNGLRAGRTQVEVAVELENRMREHGGDGPSFETIVASGTDSAVPHHRPTRRVIESGDFVTLDFGSLYAGYHSDMTRTFVVGTPSDWQREIYTLVSEAQRVGREGLQPDADVLALDTSAREVVKAAGYGEQYPHGLGHGVGLEVHETPSVGPLGTGTLKVGMPVTVEPGVYLPGRGGVRIEDLLVVRPDGPELLTTTPKDLVAV